MLRNKDIDRLKVLDRLINLENDTIDDLIEQAVTVARMIEPKLDDIASYGPIERMVMQVQEMQKDVKELRDTVRVLNMRLASNGTTSTWPSNPGFAPAYPLTTTGTSTYQKDVTMNNSFSIPPLTATQINEAQRTWSEQVHKIQSSADPKDYDTVTDAK
jgi:hypothetical protein